MISRLLWYKHPLVIPRRDCFYSKQSSVQQCRWWNQFNVYCRFGVFFLQYVRAAPKSIRKFHFSLFHTCRFSEYFTPQDEFLPMQRLVVSWPTLNPLTGIFLLLFLSCQAKQWHPIIFTRFLVWFLLYAQTRHRSILGAAGHIILTPANQLMEEYNS
jgi:hypothetical protein